MNPYGPPGGYGGYPQQPQYGGPPQPQPGYGPPQPGYPAQAPGYPAAPGYGGGSGGGANNIGFMAPSAQSQPMGMPTPQSSGAGYGGGYAAPPGAPAPAYGQPGGYNSGPPMPPQPSYNSGPPLPTPGYGAPPAQPYGGAPQGYGGAPAPTPGYGGGYQHSGAPPAPSSGTSSAYDSLNQKQYSTSSHSSSTSKSSFNATTDKMAKMTISKPKYDGTVKPTPGFDAESDAAKLRKAMKGMGTDEKAIIDILGTRTNSERQRLALMFKTMYGKDLIKDLKSELGGKFEQVVLALMMPADEYDAYELRRAMKGLGTDEGAMIEILVTRTNKEIQAMNKAYKLHHHGTLEEHIKSDTSGHFLRLMVSLANGGRMEDQPVNLEKARTDAKVLYEAGERRWGTDESRFNQILVSQSAEQLRLVFEEYSKISRNSVEKAISSEMSGDLEDGMLAIVKCVRNRSAYFAEKLYKSMKGLGTDDRTLIRLVVTRCEVDMVQIKQEFHKMYHQTLEAFIKDDCSGQYKRILLTLVGGVA